MTTMTPKRGSKVTKTWRETFIESLRKFGNVSAAARKAKVSRNYVYEQRKEDETFAAEWDDALAEAVDDLEAVAWHRARKGVRRAKHFYYLGEKVGTHYDYFPSDSLLQMLLQAHNPERFRPSTRTELTGAGGGPVQTSATVQFYLPSNGRDDDNSDPAPGGTPGEVPQQPS